MSASKMYDSHATAIADSNNLTFATTAAVAIQSDVIRLLLKKVLSGAGERIDSQRAGTYPMNPAKDGTRYS